MKGEEMGGIASARIGPVTMKSVAQAAGVSMSTVSRVLSGSVAVSELKRQAVETAIQELGFVPCSLARGLARGRSMTVGVVTQALDSPYYGPALRGVEDRLRSEGYVPLFVSGRWNTQEEKRCINTLLSRKVDGVIILTGRLRAEDMREFAKQQPIVASGNGIESEDGIYSLNFDNYGGAFEATNYLIASGHRHIAFISGDISQPNANDRLRGYRAALARADIEFDESRVIDGDFLETGGMQAVTQLCDRDVRFTAIFAANDQMAFGAALGLRRRGLRVPDDISLVGFDDIHAARYFSPPLTTVFQPAYDLGEVAASALLQMMEGKTPQLVLPPPRLMIRESVRRLSA